MMMPPKVHKFLQDALASEGGVWVFNKEAYETFFRWENVELDDITRFVPFTKKEELGFPRLLRKEDQYYFMDYAEVGYDEPKPMEYQFSPELQAFVPNNEKPMAMDWRDVRFFSKPQAETYLRKRLDEARARIDESFAIVRNLAEIMTKK